MKSTLFRLLAALPLLCSYAGPAKASPLAPPSPNAVALVKSMRFDEFVADAAAFGIRESRSQGLITDAQFNCLILQPAQWTDDIAHHFARSLTEAELAEAARFFETPAGLAFMTQMRASRDAQRRGDDKIAIQPSTAAEERELAAFLATPAGQKLLSVDGVLKPADMENLSKNRLGRAIAECTGARPTK